MSRSVLRQLTPFISSRIRQNSMLLSSAVEASSSSPSPQELQERIYMTDNCIRRLKELQAKEESNGEKMLRLSVETGGCSGFQYVFQLDDKRNADDRVFEKDGVKLVVDNVSYDFVKGATVDYVEELIRSAFLGFGGERVLTATSLDDMITTLLILGNVQGPTPLVAVATE